VVSFGQINFCKINALRKPRLKNQERFCFIHLRALDKGNV